MEAIVESITAKDEKTSVEEVLSALNSDASSEPITDNVIEKEKPAEIEDSAKLSESISMDVDEPDEPPKSEHVEMTPETYLQQVTGLTEDEPIYSVQKSYEEKDCLEKAMEAIVDPITAKDVAASVEEVLSALNSDASSQPITDNVIKMEKSAEIEETEKPSVSESMNLDKPEEPQKSEDVEMTPETYLQQVSGLNEDEPIYDVRKSYEEKDCLEKAMEAIVDPITAKDVAASVEEVLSALNSDASNRPIADDIEEKAKPVEIKIAAKPSVSVNTGKRVLKDVKKQEAPQCFVASCSSGKLGSTETKRFFKPPPNPLVFKRWARNLCQGSQLLMFSSQICENHFRPGDIDVKYVNGKQRFYIKENSLPQIELNKPKKKLEDGKRGPGRPAGSYKTYFSEDTGDSDKKATAELLSTLTDDLDSENVDPLILTHHPNLIKNAQEEIKCLDVLVCGLCHSVFHFFEEFQQHKMNVNCRGTSTFKASLSEPKPQVWAFLLWKNAQTKIMGDVESSWKLYQRWCKMPDDLRDTWIVAGKALQDASTVGHIKITDITSKVGRPKSVEQVEMEDEEEIIGTDIDTGGGDVIRGNKKFLGNKSQREDRGKGDGSTDLNDKVEIKQEVMSDLDADSMSNLGDGAPKKATAIRTNEEDKENETRKRGRPPKSLQMRQPGGQPSGKPLQEGQVQEEFVVERIVSRRFNSKKKQYEYLLKWEGYPPEQNTWEPEENMSTCRHLLKEFEANLANKQQGKSGLSITPTKSGTQSTFFGPKSDPSTSTPYSSGRPVRSSKQKALDQVKVWCGSMIKTPDEINGKRRHSDEDSDEDDDDLGGIAKRIKLEQESDDSDDEVSRRPALKKFAATMKGKTEVKRGRPPVNGIKKENLAAALGLESSGDESPDPSANKPLVRNMSSLSPQNQQVLVASAKGVVKVDPTQVPNLTSGVYIMSNKSGIVKLDSVSPSSALSSLQKKGVIKATPGKGGVIMIDSNKPGSVQKSGIIRKVPQTMPLTNTAQTPTDTTASIGKSGLQSATITVQATAKPTFPIGSTKIGSNIQITPRQSGTIKPIRSGITTPKSGIIRANSPRTVTSGIIPKVQATPIRSRIPTGMPNRSRTGLSNLLKSGIKPIESILGTSLSQISDTDENSKDDDITSGIIKINSGKKIPGNNARGKTRPFGLKGLGRGKGSLASLVGITMDEDSKPAIIKEEDVFLGLKDTKESSDSDGVPDDFPIGELPPIDPPSPPRPLTLCPLTGKVLQKAEGEKTPEPTPPGSPSKDNEIKTEITITAKEEKDEENCEDAALKIQTETIKITSSASTTSSGSINNTITVTNPSVSSATVKRISSSHRGSRTPRRGSHLSAVLGIPSSNTTESLSATNNSSLCTITVPSRKFHQSTASSTITVSAAPTTTTSTVIADNEDIVNEEGQQMVTITGEDGLLYQVSNADVAGNTLLVSSGEGGQQCVYVTTEASGEGDESSQSAVLTLDSAYADAVAQLIPEQIISSANNGCSQFYVKEGESGELVSLEENNEENSVGGGDDQGGQVVAQLVEAGEPAPGGGPRRVVLLLPNGNLMMTEVDEEQYAALELDK